MFGPRTLQTDRYHSLIISSSDARPSGCSGPAPRTPPWMATRITAARHSSTKSVCCSGNLTARKPLPQSLGHQSGPAGLRWVARRRKDVAESGQRLIEPFHPASVPSANLHGGFVLPVGSERREDSRRMERVAIIGAGPAGLTAAWELTRHGWPVTVIEADPNDVGGIARTVRYKGFCFDVGGHRFFSKSSEIESLWSAMLPNDLLRRPRRSRIYYGRRFFAYPLKPLEVLTRLGPWEAAACAASYLRACLFPVRKPRSYEDWIVNKFGQRLYRLFFKTYTEKVWGLACGEISADWAAQRIRGLSLGGALLNALPGVPKRLRRVETTLIDSFRYPRKGPGMLWEACAAGVRERGAEILMGQRVIGIERLDGRGYRVEYRGGDAGPSTLEAEQVVCSAPLADVVSALTPSPSAAVHRAAAGLRYRALVLVVLIAKDTQSLNDTWIYVQDAAIKVGRMQNYKAWSPEMVPDPGLIALGCEYFCSENDALWSLSNDALVDQASAELDRMGLLDRTSVVDSFVVRQRKAYPVYDRDYVDRVARIRTELGGDFPRLHLVGRNGMHRYNNQDHSMMTALLTVRNIMAGEARFDVLRVNQDAEYHEALPTNAQ
jgi:protoporphyrinogen oxidase